jgi:mevalonate pyrophosphate decarboxylase
VLDESEKLRNSHRQKDLDIKNLEDASQLHQLELVKWNQQREAMEAAHAATEQELTVTRQAQAELEDQKQENLVLKETIDRLRFDLDELRSREHAAGPSSSSSQFGSVSKSLGAELMNRWEALQDDEEEEEEETEEEKGSGSEGEEMIQTIITRKKRVRTVFRIQSKVS